MPIDSITMHENLTFIPFKFRQRDFKFKKSNQGSILIWDIIRKKYVPFSPEEHIRQHILHALVVDYQYPAGLISVEKSFTYNGLTKRYDILLYDNKLNPYMIIECKAPEVNLSQDVILQVSTYFTQFPCPFIMISNGRHTSILHIHEDNTIEWLQEFPVG